MDSTDEINQQLDDILLDDLVDAQEELSTASAEGLTPGEAVYEEKHEKVVNSELKRLAEELDIEESTRATAKTLFDQFVSKDTIHGYALEVLAAACLYAACKVESIPLSPDDFVAVPETAFTRVILLRRVKKISSTLGLDPSAFFDPHVYIDRYCGELGLSEGITDRAHEVISIADEAGIGGGKSPTGRAAAAIYNAVLDYGREATQSQIAKVAGVTEVTIRNRYQEQRELLTEKSGSSSESKSSGVTNTDEDSSQNTNELDVLPEKESIHSQKEVPVDNAHRPNGDSDDFTSESEEATKESNGAAVEGPPENVQKKATESPCQEMASYIGEDVASNISTALDRLDYSTKEVELQTLDVCKRIRDPESKRWFGTDEVTLALAVIRFASEELGEPIPYPDLENALEGGSYNINHVTKIVGDKIKLR